MTHEHNPQGNKNASLFFCSSLKSETPIYHAKKT